MDAKDCGPDADDVVFLNTARSRVSMDSAHPGDWHNLGIAYARLERWREAIHAYSRAIDLGYPSQVNRGVANEMIGSDSAALADYSFTLDADPNDLDALINMGTLELRRGRVERALELLQRASQADATANWQYADALLAAGQEDEALDVLAEAFRAGEHRALLDRAAIHDARGDFDAARDNLTEAMHLGVSGAARSLALLLDANEMPYEALIVAQNAVQQGDSSCFATLAIVEESLGLLHQARGHYQQAIARGDDMYAEDLELLEARIAAAST